MDGGSVAKKSKALKKGRGKKRLLTAVIAIVVLVGIIAGANAWVVSSCSEKVSTYSAVEIEKQLVPEKDDNGNWVFTTDRDFRVMQLTDVHLGGGFMSYAKDKKSINAVATMITAEKPDLVIVTGDIAYPVPFQVGTFNNKSGATLLIELLEKLGVYWTVTLGNHDSEAYSYYDRQQVSEFYENPELKYCLYQPGPDDVDGYGNHTIEVKNSDGVITQAFVMLDSHSYTDGDYFGIYWKYDNIHANQVEWYKSEINRMNEENKAVINTFSQKKSSNKNFVPVKTLAFFHIPLVEANEAWFELEANNFKDTEDAKYIDGIIGETGKRIYCGVGEDDLFEAFVETGSTKAMFNGHDHYNNATFSKSDIIFSYGYSVDYVAYIGIAEEGSQRGCTMITTKPDGSFEIDKYNYYSERYDLEGFEKEEVTMQFEGIEYQVPQED